MALTNWSNTAQATTTGGGGGGGGAAAAWPFMALTAQTQSNSVIAVTFAKGAAFPNFYNVAQFEFQCSQDETFATGVVGKTLTTWQDFEGDDVSVSTEFDGLVAGSTYFFRVRANLT